MVQQSHFWVRIQRKRNQDLSKIPSPPTLDQDAETTRFCTNDETKDVMYTCRGILLGQEKGGDPAACNTMGGPGGHCAE